MTVRFAFMPAAVILFTTSAIFGPIFGSGVSLLNSGTPTQTGKGVAFWIALRRGLYAAGGHDAPSMKISESSAPTLPGGG